MGEDKLEWATGMINTRVQKKQDVQGMLYNKAKGNGGTQMRRPNKYVCLGTLVHARDRAVCARCVQHMQLALDESIQSCQMPPIIPGSVGKGPRGIRTSPPSPANVHAAGQTRNPSAVRRTPRALRWLGCRRLEIGGGRPGGVFYDEVRSVS